MDMASDVATEMATAPARVAMAAVYEAPNEPFVLKEFPLRPARQGEVLVRVRMSTICRSDIHSYEGRRPNPCPGILGHEIIGVIEQIGAGIEQDMRGEPLKIGDRITWSEYFFEGQCYYREILDMPQKCQGLRKYGHDLASEDPHFLGGFAEYCYILPGTFILKLPTELSDEEATPLNCGVATMASVTEAAAIGLGHAVVIQGLGLLGLYGAAMAKARGARCVIGLDAVPARLEIATKFGVDHALNITGATAQSVVAQVRALCSPDGADAVVEVCGIPDVIPQGLQMLRIGGRYVIAGLVNPDANVTIDANMLVKRWITMRGVHNYHPRHLLQALDFVMANRDRFPFREIVDAKFALSDLDAAFKKAAERTVLRAAIVP
jgi:putative phosphonate catabolism associated alcohol dehydrogenase